MSEIYRLHPGQKPAQALVKWLNQHPGEDNVVFRVLSDAQVVCRFGERFPSLRRLEAAMRRDGKDSAAFEDSYNRLNENLMRFAHVPYIHLNRIIERDKVSWIVATEEPSIALYAQMVSWVLQAIEQGTLMKIRRCDQCCIWYFARSSHQHFCSTACRTKQFASSEKAKANRREYMRRYYVLKKSGKVK